MKNPKGPRSANCSIPELLFSSEDMLHSLFPMFKIIKNELCEFFMFLISGGVIAKTKIINLSVQC